MHLRYAWALIPIGLVRPHVFVGEPAPFQWDLQVTKLIMPMNGDSNYQGPDWGQQPFPCKGHHRNGTRKGVHATWYTGSRVTFQCVTLNSNTPRR